MVKKKAKNLERKVTFIPKKLTKGEPLVVLPRKDYEEFLQWKNQVSDALDKVRRGRKAYKEGRTQVADSPKDLL